MSNKSSSSPAAAGIYHGSNNRRIINRVLLISILCVILVVLIRATAFSPTSSFLKRSSSSDASGNSNDEGVIKRNEERKDVAILVQREKDEGREDDQKNGATARTRNHHHRDSEASSSSEDDQSLVAKFLLLAGLRRVAAHHDLQRGGVSRACFIALVRHTRSGLERAARLLLNVKANLPLMAARYPAVLFVEYDADEAAVIAALNINSGFLSDKKTGDSNGRGPLTHLFPAGVIVAHIPQKDFGVLPPWVHGEERGVRWPYPASSYWGVSYRYMCNFFATRVMYQEALKRFDYYFRLDTDSYILARPMKTVVVPKAAPDAVKKLTLLLLRGRAARSAHADADDMKKAAKFIEESRSSIMSSHQEASSSSSDSNNDKQSFDELGFEELPVDADYFLDTASADAKYSFNMIHPQTIPQFLNGVPEMFDEFYVKELNLELEMVEKEGGDPNRVRIMRRSSNEQPWEMLRRQHRESDDSSPRHLHHHRNNNNDDDGSDTSGSQKKKKQTMKKKTENPLGDVNKWRKAEENRHRGGSGPRPFNYPGAPAAIHFWDNYEIVSLAMFRSSSSIADASSSPSSVGEGEQQQLHNHEGILLLMGENTTATAAAAEAEAVSLHPVKTQPVSTAHLPPNRDQIFAMAFAALGGSSSHTKADLEKRAISRHRRFESTHKKALHDLRAAALGRFITHFDRAGGVFYRRWGDAEARTLTAALFLQSTEISYAQSLPYQHYHNYHCASQDSSEMPFAAERGQKVDAGSTSGRSSKSSISHVAAFLRKLGLSDEDGGSGGGGGGDAVSCNLIVRALAPARINEEYLFEKALSAAVTHLSSQRRNLIKEVHGQCERVATQEGGSSWDMNGTKNMFAWKGKGSAEMTPCEHSHNNEYIWGYVKQQGDGFLAV